MKLTKLKTLLTAALVAGAGASAWAEDAPGEEVVAFGEAEFWLGGDEVVVAFGEGGFWLGPDEIVIATDEKEFALEVFRDEPQSPADVTKALEASGAVDKDRIIELVGSSKEVYQEFRSWAKKVNGGDVAVANSLHAGDSFAFGVKELFENAPEVQFTEASISTTVSGAFDIAVTVKEGDAPKQVSSEKVAQMFEATTDLADWTKGRIGVTVKALTEGLVESAQFTVTPGDGTAEKAFLRLRK